MHPAFNGLGIACNCHPTFGEFCVFEFGQDVHRLPEVEHEHWYQEGLMDGHSTRDPFNHYPELPEFSLPHDPTCRTDRIDGVCGEFDHTEDFPEWYRDTEDQQDIAQDLFDEINEVRDSPADYSTKYDDEFVDYAHQELANWDSSYPDFTWNEGLARAARHILNDQACGQNTGLDANGNTLEEVLERYYAYSHSDLLILNVTSLELAETAPKAMEYLLAQECIDKRLFKNIYWLLLLK